MSDRGPPKKKSEAFNNPFKSALTDLKKKQAEPSQKPQAPRPPPRPARSKPAKDEDDMSLFLSAMDGVEQITHRGEPPVPNPRLPEIIDENAEALAELAELVVGQGDFDISGTGDSLEGAAPGIDARLLRSLRRGDFSIQDRLDLHGKTQTEAKEVLDRFLNDSRRARKRCVLVVHGRGLHSPDQLPVLKERLREWLARKSIAKTVLAFTTARPQDGGSGAVYVLLRK